MELPISFLSHAYASIRVTTILDFLPKLCLEAKKPLRNVLFLISVGLFHIVVVVGTIFTILLK